MGDVPGILGFDHVRFWTGNAAQAASYFICRAGFSPVGYSGLETGSRESASALDSSVKEHFSFISKHGDAVKDIAFQVKDCKQAFDFAVSRGATAVKSPTFLKDENGYVVVATIEAPFGDIWHTFVQRDNYSGAFLPGFVELPDDPWIHALTQPDFLRIDHCVCNQGENGVNPVVSWYEKTLGFHRFWSADDKDIHTEYTALRTVVISDQHENIKMPVTEPAARKGKSQVQEFVEYSGGPGIQHIALLSKNIIKDVSAWKQRGISFIQVPSSYYDNLKARVSSRVTEDWTLLKSLGILVDWDDSGYLLQILSRPVQDRPTFFLEAIQRYNHNGFGVGNFRNLFEAVEMDQAKRGNL
eukprot:jgi/Galph1/952/GphlegSOOS_G5690.1